MRETTITLVDAMRPSKTGSTPSQNEDAAFTPPAYGTSRAGHASRELSNQYDLRKELSDLRIYTVKRGRYVYILGVRVAMCLPKGTLPVNSVVINWSPTYDHRDCVIQACRQSMRRSPLLMSNMVSFLPRSGGGRIR